MSLDISLLDPEGEILFSANVTHNLNKMAIAAGFYNAVWRPEEEGIHEAFQMIEPLRAAIAAMVENSTNLRKLEPENGWGTWERFLPWLALYLEACLRYPTAKVKADR